MKRDKDMPLNAPETRVYSWKTGDEELMIQGERRAGLVVALINLFLFATSCNGDALFGLAP